MNSGTELIQKALFLRQRVNLCNTIAIENRLKGYREKLEDAFNRKEWEDKNRKGYADICKHYLRYCCYLLFEKLFIEQDKREQLEKIEKRFCGALTFFSCVSFFPHNNPQGKVVRGFINWESAIWKDKKKDTGGIDDTPLNKAICDVMETSQCNRKGKQKECQDCIGKLLSQLEFSSTPLLKKVIPNKGILHLPQTPMVTANNNYPITEIYEFIFRLRNHLKNEDRIKDFSLGICLKNSFRNTAKQVINAFAKESAENKKANTPENNLAKLVSDTDFLLNIEELINEYWLQIFNNRASEKEWDILSISPSKSRIEGDVKVNSEYLLERHLYNDKKYSFSDFLDIPLSLLIIPSYKNYYAFNILLADISTQTNNGDKRQASGSIVLYDLDREDVLSAEQMAAIFIVINEAMTSLAMYEHKLIMDAERQSQIVKVTKAAFLNSGHVMKNRILGLKARLENIYNMDIKLFKEQSKNISDEMSDEMRKVYVALINADILIGTFQATRLWGFLSFDDFLDFFGEDKDNKKEDYLCYDQHDIDLVKKLNEWKTTVETPNVRISIQAKDTPITLFPKLFDPVRGRGKCRLNDDMLNAIFYEIFLNSVRCGRKEKNGELFLYIELDTLEKENKKVLVIKNKYIELNNKKINFEYKKASKSPETGIGMINAVLINVKFGEIWVKKDSEYYYTAINLIGLEEGEKVE